MEDFSGKTAFITGGASGIGYALAEAFAEAGSAVAIADVNQARLDEAAATLRAQGATVCPVTLDVTDREAYRGAADLVERELGPIHILCNNAGLGILGPLKESTYADWDWGLSVNLGGVINGLTTILPRMRAHGQGGHILSTASAAGLVAMDFAGVYIAAKMAVVGLMEVLRSELADEAIGVSVLCPHLVRTHIYEHAGLRPQQYRESGYALPGHFTDLMKAANDTGMPARELARRVLEGIRENRLYLITHPELAGPIRDRFEAMLASIPDEDVDPARVAAEAQTLRFGPYREILDGARQ